MSGNRRPVPRAPGGVRVPWWSAMCLLAALGFAVHADPAGAIRPVVVIEVRDMIAPATADLVQRGIAAALEQRAQLVVLEMDTPGGLDTSMRHIVREILSAPIPVATFVAPEGARAASAGTYILYASHIAAMAPATNLGAATPIAIGGGTPAAPREPPESSGSRPGGAEATPAPGGDAAANKALEDAAAYLRSLAQLRGRSESFAEDAVRHGASMSAREALAAKVIDLMAADVPDLLRQLDGRGVLVQHQSQQLATSGAEIVRVAPDWRSRLLGMISQPTIAMLLMLVGVYGLFIEFTSPGFGVPGVAGALCLLLGLYALHLLPVNWAGVALIGLGFVLMIGELLMPSFGALGVGGIVAFIAGGLLMFDRSAPGFGVPVWIIVAGAVLSALVVSMAGGMALRARRRPVVTGREAMTGTRGVVIEAQGTTGLARVHGELWRIRAEEPLAPGTSVIVTGIDGLTLSVRPAPDTHSDLEGDRHDVRH